MSLRSFYNYFYANADDAVKPMWKYAEYETKLGIRREIQFIGQAALLLEVPPTDELQFLTIQTQEHRIYRHGTYMLTMLADYYLMDQSYVDIKVYGQGYQSFTGIKDFVVEAITAEGTVPRVTRFGTEAELSIKKITGVHITKRDKK